MKALSNLRQMATAEMKRKHTSYPENLTLPVKAYTDKTANGLTRCIIDFLKFSGWQAERINTTGRPIDRRQIVTDVIGNRRQIGSIEWIKSGSTPGSADISATIKGRSVKIEVKCKATGDNYQSEGQKLYQQQIEAAGGLYYIARDFQSFYDWYIQTFC
ncbi:MAG: hypothetical protein AB9834_23860 [Lentimicrobium sp.]